MHYQLFVLACQSAKWGIHNFTSASALSSCIIHANYQDTLQHHHHKHANSNLWRQASLLPEAVDNAWSSLGGGPSDLTFPELFAGTWRVQTTLVKVETPLGADYVPDMKVCVALVAAGKAAKLSCFWSLSVLHTSSAEMSKTDRAAFQHQVAANGTSCTMPNGVDFASVSGGFAAVMSSTGLVQPTEMVPKIFCHLCHSVTIAAVCMS